MRRYFAVTVIGRDRPGIVAELSRVLYEVGINIEDSSMTILMGQFAMILFVSTESDIDQQGLMRNYQGVMDKLKLFITVEELAKTELSKGAAVRGSLYLISVIGTDKPGIVYRLAELLSSKRINIRDMNTKVIPGENTTVYTMLIEVCIPEGVDIEVLEEKLAALEKEMSIDINLREIEVLDL